MEQTWTHGKRTIRTRWIEDVPDGHVTRVGAICVNKGKICLVKGKKGKKWVIPGGKPEEGETFEQAVKREILEEATIEIINPVLLGATENFIKDNPKEFEGDHFFQLYYFAEIKEIFEQTADPDGGILRERRFIDPDEFNDHIRWGDVSKGLLRSIKARIYQLSQASQEDNR